MKKSILKTLSGILISFSIFSSTVYAGTWAPHEGNLQTGVVYSWEYYNDDGSIPSGWKYIDGYWYYFEDGIARTSPLEQNGKWYYFNSDSQLFVNKYVKVGQGSMGIYYWTDQDGVIDFNKSWLPK